MAKGHRAAGLDQLGPRRWEALYRHKRYKRYRNYVIGYEALDKLDAARTLKFTIKCAGRNYKQKITLADKA